ncbi:MAG TPA: V-type ATP synthase subunit D [Candidatus Anaerotruncus excrementipullorum]|mgnify:FL=1|uniref:V-type ATP synthase subunit D n=1 Tax=Candidatus Anaerotruncus excrementipullorum TaxID=2838465 RepID=A0A9D2B7L4_9FIRM|nr:V-type ATP synthase subunit D [Candidatus Anaerotruncus excrementipullorum]
MDSQRNITPTKGSLMALQKSLELSTLGYDLMDRKRNILIRELMELVDKAKALRGQIGQAYGRAYTALQEAIATLGLERVLQAARAVEVEDGLTIQYRSVMGVELPTVKLEPTPARLGYGVESSNSRLDEAYLCFWQVKQLTATLAEVETSVQRLAVAIRKTQRRANALEHVVIPRDQEAIRFISDALEEKEREEFSRMKVIKALKNAGAL